MHTYCIYGNETLVARPLNMWMWSSKKATLRLSPNVPKPKSFVYAPSVSLMLANKVIFTQEEPY